MVATEEYIEAMVPLIIQLWPDNTRDEAIEIIKEYLYGEETGAMVHFADTQCVGLALCSLRHDYVEGCESSPVGYLEGIVVDANYRKSGIAKILCAECEQWAKDKGCKEFASDCEITNEESLRFHLHMGYTEENRIICFKKEI
ncbi:GNAT family N-acetyltransferase [Enterocloster bolteae]|nr:GNAT family N-acetyltransferase [Campylobacter coli]MCB7089404.1 GNAT family N-acetyltransferase [Enterocloster bolteae]HEL3030326.1 GNAT family N-acetyltransferase [Clostridioides difficile]ECO2755337.1 GNAT family N-acetyltransferase [Campylobacter coli]HEE9533056.1 GNAT family N-acetyltransferase [Campylobacter coli]